MRIGFIGIGNMGAPMATHLVRGGHHVTVHDLDAGRVEAFAREHRAHAAASVGDLAESEVVVTMLPTGKHVREALTAGGRGALAAMLAPGTIVIDMSSSEPTGTRALGAELAESGIILIDAPVSGGVVRATSGTLAIMVGGDDHAAILRARPVLTLMGDRLFETGRLGSGHAMKALNNMVAAAAFAATAEALMIGAEFGLDRAKMVDILNVSTGRNFHTDVVMKEHVVGGKFATGFAVGLLAKDVGIAEALGREMAIEAPVTRLVSRRWAQARDAIGAGRDNSEAYLAWSKPAAKRKPGKVKSKAKSQAARATAAPKSKPKATTAKRKSVR